MDGPQGTNCCENNGDIVFSTVFPKSFPTREIRMCIPICGTLHRTLRITPVQSDEAVKNGISLLLLGLVSFLGARLVGHHAPSLGFRSLMVRVQMKSRQHVENQLLFASEGGMSVEAEEGIWVMPPLRAVCIPALTPHSVSMSGRVSMQTLYFSPRLCRFLPRRCLIINIFPLLRGYPSRLQVHEIASTGGCRATPYPACLCDQIR